MPHRRTLGIAFISVFFIKALLSVVLGTGFDPMLVTTNAVVFIGVGIILIWKSK